MIFQKFNWEINVILKVLIQVWKILQNNEPKIIIILISQSGSFFTYLSFYYIDYINSAKDNVNINEAFQFLINSMIRIYKPNQQKS